MSWFFAAAVLLPVWVWSPTLLDDARLDGALLSLLTLFAFLKFRPASIPGTKAFLLFLCLGLAPLFFTPLELPTLAIWGGLVDRAPLLSAFVLLGLGVQQSNALNRAWPWIFGGIFAAAGYGLLQLFGLDPLHWRPMEASAPTAPLPGTNHAAEVLAPTLLAAIAFGWPRSPRIRAAVLSPVAFFLGSLHVLAPWISIPIGALFLRPWKNSKVIFPLLLVLASMAIGNFWAKPKAEVQPQEETAPSHDSFEIRWLTDLSVAQHAFTHPLGIGLGQYEKSHPHWQNPDILRVASHNYSDPATPRAKDPHNEVLLVWVESGWLGLAFLCLCLFQLLRRPERSTWPLVPLVALGFHACVRSPFSDNATALALGALWLATSEKQPSTTTPKTRNDWFSSLLPSAFALLAAVAAIPQLIGEVSLSRAIAEGEVSQTKLTAEEKHLRRSLRWRPWHAVSWDLEASRLSRTGGKPNEVRTALRQAIQQDPADLFALTSLLKLEMLSGSPLLAHDILLQAESFAAQHPSIREARTLWLEEMGANQNHEATLILMENQAKARAHFLMGHAFLALAAARRDDYQSCKEELIQTGFYAGENRPLFERMARKPEPDELSVRELLLRTLADSEPYLGPGPEKD